MGRICLREGVFFMGTVILQAALLAASLSLDALAACLAFGAQGIRVPASSALVLGGGCSGLLAVSLAAGSGVSGWVPPQAAAWLSFLVLGGMGLVRLCDSAVKGLIRTRWGSGPRRLDFSLMHLRFLLLIYADSTQADVNGSQDLSPKEAASLAAALSLDGLAAGFGAGVGQGGTPGEQLAFWATAVVLCLGCSLASVWGGCRLGRMLARRLSRRRTPGGENGWEGDLSWLSGTVLLLLGAAKLRRLSGI